MSGQIKRFEDLIAWQKARELAWKIYQTTKKGDFSRDFGLSRQIQRSAVSIMSNIAEGFERGSVREFHRFLSIAKGSWAELRSQLYIAFDAEYLDQYGLDELLDQAEEVGRIIGGLRADVERRRDSEHQGP